MIRRRFLQLLGLVPTIAVTHSGVMDHDGSPITRAADRDVYTSTVYTYGRVSFTGCEIAAHNRKNWEAAVDLQLLHLKRDYMRNYDQMLAGKAPISWNDNGPVYLT